MVLAVGVGGTHSDAVDSRHGHFSADAGDFDGSLLRFEEADFPARSRFSVLETGILRLRTR
jgi:hypothetical protein